MDDQFSILKVFSAQLSCRRLAGFAGKIVVAYNVRQVLEKSTDSIHAFLYEQFNKNNEAQSWPKIKNNVRTIWNHTCKCKVYFS